MDLLTEMLELVKPGEEKTQLFAMLFLRRLPAEVRILLTEDDHSDLRALAEKANHCVASMAHQTIDASLAASTAVVSLKDSREEAVESSVASVSQGGSKLAWGGRGCCGRGGKGGKGRGSHRGGSHQQSLDALEAPADVALPQIRVVPQPLLFCCKGVQLRAALQLAGKLERRDGINAIRPGHLIFVSDIPSGVKFLVDTGASFLAPPQPLLLHRHSLPLLARLW